MPAWRPAALSMQEYLSSAGKLDYVRALAANPQDGTPNPNLLRHINGGGLLKKGVCWWHSRFTRNALYLAYFLPDEKRPDERETRLITGRLMMAGGVTAIPGFPNLREFSEANWALIQKTLERRQIIEGFLQFAWINGLAGRSRVSPARMETLMKRVHSETSSKGISYVKFQTPGLDAHALLITRSEPLPDGGYALRYLDSNLPREAALEYRPGDTHLSLESHLTGVPYLQRKGELARIAKVIAGFARTNSG